MNKQFIVLCIAIFASSITAMNLAETTDITVLQSTTNERIATPRLDRRPKEFSRPNPARQAYDFINLINSKYYDKVLNTLLLANPLKAYGPALVLRNVISGEIPQTSPLACKEAWESYILPGIEKNNFLECCIYIADTMEQSYNHDEKMAKNYFLVKSHLKILPSSELVSPEKPLFVYINNRNYADALKFIVSTTKTFSTNTIVMLLREIVTGKVKRHSPFARVENWLNYVPSDNVDKKELLLTALYIVKKRIAYYQKRNRDNKIYLYKKLQDFLVELRKIK